MKSLVYVSTATTPLSAADLAALVAAANDRNERLGITGMLLCAAGGYLQELEGPDDAVAELFASIERDPRHTGVTVMAREDIDARTHYRWSMALVDVERDWLESLVEDKEDGSPVAALPVTLAATVRDAESARTLLRLGPRQLRAPAEQSSDETRVVFLQS